MWIEITSADLQQKLTTDEFDAVTTVSLPSGVSAATIIADEITRTINEVRGYVAACKTNVLGDGATIPAELLDAALCILRHKIFSRLPGMKGLLDEIRVREFDEAMRKLRDAAACRFSIVPPTTPADADEQPVAGTVSVVTKQTRWASRETLGGLF